LLLRAGIHGTTVAILLYVVYNIVYAAHAFPAGILSDRVGRKPVVLTGYVAFIAMATLLVFSDLLATLVLAFVLYGLSYGMAEGTQRALVADFAPPSIKATVLGAYHTCVGAVKLASGVVAGLLWIAFAVLQDGLVAASDEREDLVERTLDDRPHGIEAIRETAAVYDVHGARHVLPHAHALPDRRDAEFRDGHRPTPLA